MPRLRRAHLGLMLGVLLLTLSCGGAAEPTDAAGVLASRLDGVDAAIAAGDYDQARTAVRALITSTKRADRTGDLDGSQADRITAAAAALLEQLPGELPGDLPTTTTPTTTSSPQTESTTSPTPAPYKGKSYGKGKSKGKSKGKGRR